MRLTLARLLTIVTLIAGALVLVRVASREREADPARMTWIATASQFGPVGYRDPVGAISLDGRLIAYSEGRFVRVRPIDGGPIIDLPAGDGQIRYMTWHPDSRTLLTDGDASGNGWVLYDHVARTRRALFDGRETLSATEPATTTTRALRQPSWSRDGKSIAALVNGRDGVELWIAAADGSSATATRLTHGATFPTWTHRGEVACVAAIDGRLRVTIPCDGSPLVPDPDLDVYGPIAFAPDGATVYTGMPNSGATLDLWALPIGRGPAKKLTAFARDSYAPTVTSDGRVLFKLQSYRTHVATAPAEGGPSTVLTTFQSETPSWDPSSQWIGITYGTWRRVVDDAKYPDIAQEAGIIDARSGSPLATVSTVVDASDSEDQSLCWSPNGKWIAYHSHKEQSDDIWLRPADGSAPGRRISGLGRGAETGWPRWSPDGRWLLFDGADPKSRRSALFLIGINQDSGQITEAPRPIVVDGVDAEISHGEWLPDSEQIVAIAKEAAGRHVIFIVPRDGGRARVVHRFDTEHDAPGLTISPDGRDVAFIAPSDRFFQVFALPLAGGSSRQLTFDQSHKTQPAWSPDGRRLAFTVWSYEVQFWQIAAAGPR
jgi:Tol biopolymer transport system component